MLEQKSESRQRYICSGPSDEKLWDESQEGRAGLPERRGLPRTGAIACRGAKVAAAMVVNADVVAIATYGCLTLEILAPKADVRAVHALTAVQVHPTPATSMQCRQD